MKKVELFLERVYDDRVRQDWDHIIPVVGDEGAGKSTFMLLAAWLYKQIREETPDTPTPDAVLDQVVWDDHTEFQTAMVEYERRTIIPVMDAARVLHKKQAMTGEQIETEKDLLDVRMKNFVFLLGFQDWGIIPSMLQERRAKNAFYIPRRGVVHGYSRDSMDERVFSDNWPEPDLRSRFPSLEGTDLWAEFERRDREHKEDRMAAKLTQAEGENDGNPIKDVVNEIKENGITEYVSVHGGNKQQYIDPDLIEIEHNLSARQANKVKKLLARDSEVQVQDTVTA